MRCITCNLPSITSMVTNSKSHQQHFNTVKSIWPSNTSKASCLRQRRTAPDGLFTGRASPDTLFMAATSPPNSGDLSVLFQTGAVMLFVYWIANFVVPEAVMKDLQRDEENTNAEGGDPELSNNEQGSTSRTTSGSGTKRRGFNSTRQ